MSVVPYSPLLSYSYSFFYLSPPRPPLPTLFPYTTLFRAKFAADTLAELDRNPADMVLADAVMTGALMAAESRGMPRAALVPNIYISPAPGIPPIGVGFAQAHGPIGRLRDRVTGAMMDRM